MAATKPNSAAAPPYDNIKFQNPSEPKSGNRQLVKGSRDYNVHGSSRMASQGSIVIKYVSLDMIPSIIVFGALL